MRIQLDTQASHTGAVAANAAVAAEVTEAAAPAAATAVASAVAAAATAATTTAAAEVHANRDTPKQTCQKRSQCAEPLCKNYDQEKRANRSSHITPKSALRPRRGHDLDAQTVLQHCGRLAKHYPCLHAHHCNDRFTPPFMDYIQIASPVHQTQ